jgi:hypothetical protein
MYHHPPHRDNLTGLPTSEVGYTSATTGRGDLEVHKGHVVALERKKIVKHESIVSVQRAVLRQFNSDPPSPIALDAGISSFRQLGAVVKEKLQDGRVLIRVWQELDYRLDVCGVTKGAHIDHLWACSINWYNYSFIF